MGEKKSNKLLPNHNIILVHLANNTSLLEQLVKQNLPLLVINPPEEHIINSSILPEYCLDAYLDPSADNSNKNTRLILNKKEQYKKPYLPKELLIKH